MLPAATTLITKTIEPDGKVNVIDRHTKLLPSTDYCKGCSICPDSVEILYQLGDNYNILLHNAPATSPFIVLSNDFTTSIVPFLSLWSLIRRGMSSTYSTRASGNPCSSFIFDIASGSCFAPEGRLSICLLLVRGQNFKVKGSSS